MDASVATVQSLCEQVDGDMILLRERAETAGRMRDYLIRRRVGEEDFLEVRCARYFHKNLNCIFLRLIFKCFRLCYGFSEWRLWAT